MQRIIPGSGFGYGEFGSSTTKRVTKGFTALSGSPQQDIDYNNYTMRQRGRLMFMGNPVAASAVNTHRTNTIGVGLIPNPRPDSTFLHLTEDKAAEWTRTVKREFSLWADDKRSCDACGTNNFYELQQMLFSSWLMSGDVFVLIQEGKADQRRPYKLRLRALEADRVATPYDSGFVFTLTTGKNTANGNTIYDGVEVDGGGKPVAYHIRNANPLDFTRLDSKQFTRIEAEGKTTGLPNILHIMTAHRPEQYRGVSFLAPVIISLLQVGRYTEAELAAAVVNAFFTVYITSEENGEDPAREAYGDDQSEVSDSEYEYEMGPGQVNILPPGEKPEPIKAEHPSGGFGAFMDAIVSQIGAALEIPKEILLKQFTASYSASRGALLEAWKSFKTYRQWFVNDFCDPVYELFLCEAVASGRVVAPGFFSDPAVRKAWLKCQWIGPAQGQLDPVKEVNAEILACQNGFSTYEDSALRLNGSDFNANVERLATELKLMTEAGLIMTPPDNTEEGGEGDGKEDKADAKGVSDTDERE